MRTATETAMLLLVCAAAIVSSEPLQISLVAIATGLAALLAWEDAQ